MTQLTQREKQLLEQIGENSTLLMLAIQLKNIPGWMAYKTVSDAGNDIILTRIHGTPKPGYKKKLLIEVKARQLVFGSSAKNHSTFSLSIKERNDSDFLIGYWFEHGDFFVVPKKILKPTYKKQTNQLSGYYFKASYDQNSNQYNPETSKFLNSWHLIFDKLK